MTDDLTWLDGLALADLIRQGEVTPKEVLDGAVSRIERLNPALNAVVTPLYDQARAAIEAGLPDGPFRGVPFALKQLVVSSAGAPATAASRLLADNVPTIDSEIVARHRRSGLVIVGKTNSSEFGIAPATESALYGPARNPWRLDLSPGGSSGGSAAAVAAGMLPLAHATDGGGSIRIPASACGLFGLKPTRGRITAGPESGEGLAGLAHQHAVTRSVRDSAALLDATQGPLAGDPYAAPPPAGPYLAEIDRSPGRLRIAVSSVSPLGTPVAPDCVAAVEDAAKLCAALGHDVELAAPDFDAQEVARGFLTVFAANTMANIARKTGGPLPEEGRVEPLTYAIAERGRSIPAADYIRTLQSLHRQSRSIAAFFSRCDVWLTPTLGLPPQPIGAFATATADVDGWMARVMTFIAFTHVSNVTGQPAMSVPLFWSAEGLPIGVQFASASGREDLLFRLAAQLERARPWAGRRPPPPSR